MEKINIAEILKDCPKGMKLDCAIYENVEFDYVEQSLESTYPIHCLMKTNEGYNTLVFTHYGCNDRHPNAKCVIFPKGKTTWEGFQRPFKDGDVLCNDKHKSICIYKEYDAENRQVYSYCGLNIYGEFILSSDDWTIFSGLRFATEEEKQKLFDAIKANGYKWNSETKTLEKLIEPKFKVGDKVRYKGESTVITITDVKDNYYFIKFYNPRKNDYQTERISFKDQDDWELVPNKFDITTLKPFDKVLVRHSDTDYWKPAFWAKHITNLCSPFISSYGFTTQAIPFKGNEWLVGTTDNCNEYYKTWETL